MTRRRKLTETQVSALLSCIAAGRDRKGPCCDSSLLERCGMRGATLEAVQEVCYQNAGCEWGGRLDDVIDGVERGDWYASSVYDELVEKGLA